MRRIVLAGLAVLAVSCGSPDAANPEVARDEVEQATSPENLPSEIETPVPQFQPQSLEPIDLDDDRRRALLRAFAGSEQASRVVRRKSETGFVEESAGGSLDFAEAERNLAQTQAALAEMSKPGLPTFLLLHQISRDQVLWSWLIGPEGVIAVDRAPGKFTGLDHVVDGLGVTRLASTRSMRMRGEPKPTEEERAAALKEDQSPRALALRKETIRKARDVVLPGTVGDALGKSAGRLLVVAAKDTGTAPYAALPLENGFAARNWSFVIMPDVKTLASGAASFDHKSIDLSKAIIVGDPDLSGDSQYDWDPLPGARNEAKLVARRLGIAEQDILMGEQATQRKFRRSIQRMSGEGLVYIASHAVADARNPLTRGFIAMAGEHYYAGYIRQEKFDDWKRKPPLVVVSACQTALGRVLDGGGFGVTQSWYEAGAGQVVGSLWNVSDPATLLLMHHFTKRLVARDAPEIAMQYAQQRTMEYKDKSGNQPYRDDPKMWASFAIFGKPSRDPVK